VVKVRGIRSLPSSLELAVSLADFRCPRSPFCPLPPDDRFLPFPSVSLFPPPVRRTS
jgi:hypothetical protein